MFEVSKSYILNLGLDYGVNPSIFGFLCIVSVLWFIACIIWIIKVVRQKKSVEFAGFCAILSFMPTYCYLLAAHKSIPYPIYFLLLFFSIIIFSCLKDIVRNLFLDKAQ